jgi:hypothetical protein
MPRGPHPRGVPALASLAPLVNGSSLLSAAIRRGPTAATCQRFASLAPLVSGNSLLSAAIWRGPPAATVWGRQTE